MGNYFCIRFIGKLKRKPYHLLLVMAMLLFLADLFYFSAPASVPIQTKYICCSTSSLVWALSLVFFILWVSYLFTNDMLYSKTLAIVHLLVTIVSCLLILSLLYYQKYQGLAGSPRRYYGDELLSKTDFYTANLLKETTVFLFILITGQLLYLINLFLGLFKGVRAHSK